MSKPYIVIGGGMSGMAAAHFLRSRGVQVELLEQSGALGGRVAPGWLGDRRVDLGGKNIGRKYTQFRSFAASLGFDRWEYFGLNTSRVEGGELRTLDASRRLRGIFRLAEGSSPMDFARFGRFAARVKWNRSARFLGSKASNSYAERYDDRPASAYFTKAFVDRLVRPLVVRTNGAEPDEVFLGTFVSNAAMLLDTYEQLPTGMGPLVDEFAARHRVRTHARVERLVVADGRVRAVRWVGAEGASHELECEGVVLAVPAPVAAALLGEAAPEASRALSEVRYFPVGVVVAEYERDVFEPQARAILFPAESALSNAGAYGVDALNVVRYTFSGRAARALAGARGDELVERAEAELGRFRPVREAGRLAFTSRWFEPGLCAFAPHYPQVLAAVRRGLAPLANAAVAGDYVKGASIEACFESAREAVSLVVESTSYVETSSRRVECKNTIRETTPPSTSLSRS